MDAPVEIDVFTPDGARAVRVTFGERQRPKPVAVPSDKPMVQVTHRGTIN